MLRTLDSYDGDALTLDMYGAIGTDWYGDGSTIDAKAVAKVLSSNKDAKTINLNISSGGGDPFHALAIYQQLKDHGAKIVANIQGLAASAMTIIACAADEIVMNAAGLFMIHEAKWGTFGTAAEQQAVVNATEKMNEQAASIYAARTGQKLDDVKAAMSATTWMTAQEAKDAGYVNSISPLKAMAATVQPDQFENVPDHIKPLLARIQKAESTDLATIEQPADPTLAIQMERERSSSIVAACQMVGKPDLALSFLQDSKETSSSVLAKLQAQFIAERQPIADVGGANVGPAKKSTDAAFEAEYDKNSEYFSKSGLSKEAYVASRRNDID